MTSPTPDIAELRRLHSEWQETVNPYGFQLMPSGEYYALVVAAVNALPDLLDAAAERDALIAERDEAMRALGKLTAERDAEPDRIAELAAERDALAAERDALLAIIDDARHALSADGPKVEPARQVLARALPQITAWQDRTRRARDNTPPHVIAHRGAQLDAVTAERDALAAKVARVENAVERALRHGYDLDRYEVAEGLGMSLDGADR